MVKIAWIVLAVIIITACHRVPEKTLADHQTVNLSSKQLTSFPKEILSYKDVMYLQLGVENVMVYSTRPSMTVVKGANKIKKLPKNIDVLHNLRLLDLSFNILKHLPESFYNLKQLESLDVSYNKEIPLDQIERLQALPNLKKLYLIGIINNQEDSLRIERAFSNTNTHVYLNWSDLSESVFK